MKTDYNFIVSLSEQKFNEQVPTKSELEDPEKFTKSDVEDIMKIERLLDIKHGTLAGQDHYLEKIQCSCSRFLTIYDFVFTGLLDAGHPKSFILHLFVGNKYVINTPKQVRCSNCSKVTPLAVNYGCSSGYFCGN